NSGHSNNHSVADKIVVRTDPSFDALPPLDLQHWYTVSSDERADRAVEVSQLIGMTTDEAIVLVKNGGSLVEFYSPDSLEPPDPWFAKVEMAFDTVDDTLSIIRTVRNHPGEINE